MTRAPLEGYRILDLALYLTGAGAVGHLADLGADVIKIENPQSPDPSRNSVGGMQMLESCNRNKRCMTLDLKSEHGRQILYRLVEQADVVAENFRPGVAARLGVEHSILKQHNPGIILASFNGYGSKGPDAEIGAFDMLGHARSGLMDILSDHRPPTPIRYVGPIALADEAGAMWFAFAIVAALASRAVDGVGQHVEVSHLSALMAMQSYPLHDFLMEGGELPRPPDRKTEPPLSNIYEGSDEKWFATTSIGERYWPAFCEAAGTQELMSDARFADEQSRAANREELVAILDGVFRTRPRDEWFERFKEHRLNVSPVQDYHDLLEDPQVAANGYLQEVDHPVRGRMKIVAPPVSFSETPPRYRNSVPDVGEHTDEILLEHGFSQHEIRGFHETNVI